jgi:DNA-binding transcriptional MerR regulator
LVYDDFEVRTLLINQVCETVNLTKKAIEYYIEQDLIHPVVLENNYRDFSQSDVERLTKISMYRRLGLSVHDIKAVLSDNTGEALQRIAIQKELNSQREKAKKATLDKLCRGQSYADIITDLESIDFNATITEKLLHAFPGYFGRFLSLHFARFLNNPIDTVDERLAYAEIISFLDNSPALVFPDDVQAFLDENTMEYSPETINIMLANTKQAIENPEAFVSENKETMQQYLEFKQSDEYRVSPLSKLKTLLKDFCGSSGYYDIFIPAMKRLSKPYAEYYSQLETADEKMLTRFPEIEKVIDE